MLESIDSSKIWWIYFISKQTQHSALAKNSQARAQPQQHGHYPDFTKVQKAFEQRLVKDPKFRYLQRTPVPKVSYANINDVVYLITNGGNRTTAYFIALDSFSFYRLKVLEFIGKLKKQSLHLGEHVPNRTKVLALNGVIFDIFNKAQKHLTTYHENQIKAFTNYFDNAIQRNQSVNSIKEKLRNMLSGYESKMKQMKGAIQSSLAMLYAMHIDGL